MPPQPSAPLRGGLVEIRTTFGSEAAATACAERLVRERVAACVQVDGPLRSTYHWQGNLTTSPEWRCTCKTTLEAREACITALLAAHEYDTPQVVAVPLEASPAYADWVCDNVRRS